MPEGAAAIDLGTTRLRLGAWRPGGALELLAERPSAVAYGADGSVRCAWSAVAAAIDGFLADLAGWCRRERIDRLRLAICGHTASLLRWPRGAAAPAEDAFAIWMDAGGAAGARALADLAGLHRAGDDLRWLGTRLPPAGGWLAVKLRAHHQRDPDDACLAVQVQDAAFHRLTGAWRSHPSSQMSLVHQERGGWSPEMLAWAGIDPGRLPALDPAAAPLLAGLAAAHGLPPVQVLPGMQDTTAALLGLDLADGDGFLLAGTSEIAGVCTAAPLPAPPALTRARRGAGWVTYGGAASGGATRAWLLGVLGQADPERLSAAAAALPPGADGVVALPYLAGERAPLWDAAASGTFLGLRPHHGPAHLLRAVLEGVACARRQVFDALGRPLPPRIVCAGGGAADPLANRIRAAVLGRPLAVLPGFEPALLGGIRHASGGGGPSAPAAVEVRPDPAWAAAYPAVQARFLAAQATLGLSIPEPIHA